jgi:uncharacterized iron-regulated membrane protein
MLSQIAIRRWYGVHKWTSLVCTVFLLMLCLTGLPLIFHDEIDHALGNDVEAPAMPAGTPRADLDRLAAVAGRTHPELVVRYINWDQDEPDSVMFSMAPKVDSPPNVYTNVVLDARTGKVLHGPSDGLVRIIYDLHSQIFAGIPGKLLLGFMGLLLLASLVSGTVLYAPFMRKIAFGTVRKRKTTRIRWLDLHNLLGIASLLWLLVVGTTGVINSCAEMVFKYWQFDQIAAMAAPYRDKPAIGDPGPGSLERAMHTALEATPGMYPRILAYPGSPVSSKQHYMVFMSGTTPLTKKLGKPLLIDAVSGELTDIRESPTYLSALLISQPLHFGDYGGMPFKILWTLFDLVTIVVLGSGVYLWWTRRRQPVELRMVGFNHDAGLFDEATAAREISP